MPDGVLSQEGVAARVREHLVRDLNLRFVVKLPRGVFEPYTKSSTSILFFDTDGTTDEIETHHTLSDEHIDWFRAGSALNLFHRA